MNGQKVNFAIRYRERESAWANFAVRFTGRENGVGMIMVLPQPLLCSIEQGTFWFDGQVFGLFVCRHKVSYSYVSATYSENNDLCGFLRLFILWEVRFFAAQPLHYFAHYFTSKYVPPCILLSKHRSAISRLRM